MHHWISGDCGLSCYACGTALDFVVDGEDWIVEYEQAALDLCPPCGSGDHHFILEGHPAHGYILTCAYGDAVVDPTTMFDTIPTQCRRA